MADKDWEIVPERDDALINSRKSKPAEPRKATDAAGRKPANSEPGRSRGGDSMALWSFIFLLVFASLGANLYLYLSLADTQAENLALDTRVMDLEGKLSVTDESLSQSGAAIQALLKEHASELELHISEIRKLWAVAYDRNRPAIETLQAQMTQAQQQLAGIQNLTSRMTQVEQRSQSIGSQSLIVAADVEQLGTSVRSLTDTLNSLRTSFQQVQTSQREQSEAIAAIDAFRVQINQRLLRLEAPPAATP